MPQVSRRALGALLGTPLLAAQAQAPAPAEDLAALAQNQNKANAERLAKFKIEMSVEPAFAFKP